MKRNAKFYWTLFRSTFSLSAFTVGGGFVIVPLMKKRFVDELHWIDENEMLDIAAIAQSTPGAIAVNASILIGYRLAGLLGALVTILGGYLAAADYCSASYRCFTRLFGTMSTLPA